MGEPIEDLTAKPAEAESVNNQKSEPELYKRSIQGGYWVMGIGLSGRFLGFIKTLFYANLLVVQDLGLLAITMMLIEVLGVFFETGFKDKLIQEKKDIHPYLDTAWVIQLLRGLAMFLVLFLAAPIVASWKVPEEKVSLTIAVIRGIGFSILLGGFENIGTVFLYKQMEFSKVFWLRLLPLTADLVVSVTVIFFYRSIWGYVAGRFAEVFVRLALSYSLCPYRPHLSLDWGKARELWKFGKWIFGLSILNFLISEGDDFFVWWYLGVSSLALYRYAFRFSNLPATDLTNTLSQVTFPAYSKIQDDIPRLREAYLKVLMVISFFSFPLAGLIFILGPDFVQIFLKEDMHPMIPAMQIMAFKGLFRSLGAARGPLFLALGKPKIHWILQCVRLFLLAVLIYPLTRSWGIEGTATATTLIAILLSPIGFWLVCRWLKCSVWRMLQPFLIPMAAASVVVLILVLVKSAAGWKVSPLLFGGLLVLAIVCYGGTVWLLDSISKFGLLEILKDQVNVLRRRKNSL
jgi:O-antigen/teichoic acid export membrane protein